MLGIQFETLFEDGLYLEISRHAVDMALKIHDILKQHGVEFLYDSPTNQQFPILPDSLLAQLSEDYTFTFWEKVDHSRSAVRFCTSWATRPENVETLTRDIVSLLQKDKAAAESAEAVAVLETVAMV
ncbi:hypothetical protein D3C74_357260 [compost metagenome]